MPSFSVTGILIGIAALVAVACSGLLVRTLIPILVRNGYLDMPLARSSHSLPVPRGAGLAVASAYTVALLVWALLASLHHEPGVGLAIYLGLITVAFAMIGALEDLVGVSIRYRLLLQLAVGLAGGGWLLHTSGASEFWLIPAMVAMAAYVNIANFMDGINGISSLHGLVCGVTYAIIGGVTSHNEIVVSGILLASAFVGFMPWNIYRARVFLGDSGSYFLGGGVVTLAVAAAAHGGVQPELAVAPLLVYLADTCWTLLTRLRAREKIYEAHRSHVYQRLAVKGIGHVGAASILTAISICVALLAALGNGRSSAIRIGTDFSIVAMLLIYLCLPNLAFRIRSTPDSAAGNTLG